MTDFEWRVIAPLLPNKPRGVPRDEKDPAWVDRFVMRQAATARWLIPNAILFSRLKRHSGRSFWKYAASLPIALAATVSTLPPAILANKRLKQLGAAATW